MNYTLQTMDDVIPVQSSLLGPKDPCKLACISVV